MQRKTRWSGWCREKLTFCPWKDELQCRVKVANGDTAIRTLAELFIDKLAGHKSRHGPLCSYRQLKVTSSTENRPFSSNGRLFLRKRDIFAGRMNVTKFVERNQTVSENPGHKNGKLEIKVECSVDATIRTSCKNKAEKI